MISYNFNPIVFRRLYNVHLKLKKLTKRTTLSIERYIFTNYKKKIFFVWIGNKKTDERSCEKAIEMGNHKLKWTEEEEEALLAGVQKHGPGKWKNIIRDPEFADPLYNRSNIDLKVSSFLLSAVCSLI